MVRVPTGGAKFVSLRLKFWKQEEEDAASDEEHRRPGFLADFILGGQDGLVNVLGVILGAAVGAQAQNVANPVALILAVGLAATFAESISMGAVAYTSTVARRDHYLSEVDRERREMKDLPDIEREEVREILRRWEFHGDELEEMLEKITSKPKAWLELMMAHELNLAPVDKGQARKSAFIVGTAAIIGSLIPLLPFLGTGNDIYLGIAWSLGVSAITLFLIGWYKAKVTVGRPARSGLQMLLIGIVSALVGFGIAYLVSGGAFAGG